jgi:hypothetical protein
LQRRTGWHDPPVLELKAMADSDVDGGAPSDLWRDGDGYPSDHRDAEARLAPLIPEALPGGRPLKTDMRAALNAVLYRLRELAPLVNGAEFGFGECVPHGR